MRVQNGYLNPNKDAMNSSYIRPHMRNQYFDTNSGYSPVPPQKNICHTQRYSNEFPPLPNNSVINNTRSFQENAFPLIQEDKINELSSSIKQIQSCLAFLMGQQQQQVSFSNFAQPKESECERSTIVH